MTFIWSHFLCCYFSTLKFFSFKRLNKSRNKGCLILSWPSHFQARIICYSPARNYLQWCFTLSILSNCYPSVSIKPLSHLSHLNILFLFLNTSNQILTSNMYIEFPKSSVSEHSIICYFLKNVTQHLTLLNTQ
jgi:hypothetical protein